jgi:hypothetical protein
MKDELLTSERFLSNTYCNNVYDYAPMSFKNILPSEL